MQQIRKAVIPAAGIGTRFLPITKSIPKEMLPIIDIPTIQIVVEEAVKAGIREVIIVNNRDKKALEHYFQKDEKLESELLNKNKEDLVNQLRQIEGLAKVTFVYQDNPKGLGHAVLCAKEAVGDEPFAVLLGDDVVINHKGKPVLKQLINAYNETHCSVVGVQKVPKEDVVKYGIVDPEVTAGRLSKLKDMVEKPSVENAPSQLAILGCYVLTPKIFELLETQVEGRLNEIQLTDAIKRLIDNEGVYAYDFVGQRYDVGDKLGYIIATIDFAMKDVKYHDAVLEHIKEIVKKGEKNEQEEIFQNNGW